MQRIRDIRLLSLNLTIYAVPPKTQRSLQKGAGGGAAAGRKTVRGRSTEYTQGNSVLRTQQGSYTLFLTDSQPCASLSLTKSQYGEGRSHP